MSDQSEPLAHARHMFHYLETNDAAYERNSISVVVDIIKDNLKKAAVDFAALDPTGKNSSEEMRSRLLSAEKRAHLITAQKSFAHFETSTATYDELFIRGYAETIQFHLTQADTDLSTLDPSGKSSSEDMRVRFLAAAERCHLIAARSLFDNFEKGRSIYANAANVVHAATVIHHRLDQAGKDLSALDPSGKSTAEQMKSRLDDAAASAMARIPSGSILTPAFAFGS